MFDVASRESQIRSEPTTTAPDARSIRAGLVASSVLHLAVILLAFLGVPWSTQAPPSERIVPVNLVHLADKTAAPASALDAPLPQEQAREIAPPTPANAVPVPAMPPPPEARRENAENSPPPVLTAIKPAPRPPMPKPLKSARLSPSPAARLRQQASPADDLAARLRILARLHQTSAPIPPAPRQQDGSGLSNVTAAASHAARAWDATYSVKDFIRAQVERRWNLDRSAMKGATWAVSIHILLDPSGRVRQAEIVDDPRYHDNTSYWDFARSARNAVLLSSPLAVPPGTFDIAKDIIVDFDPKQLSQ